ncbi:MAG TPA: 4-coumarate--CoA ligase family protein [Pyrinomonadaceae bacterium]|nr:4-coumarate--CoA ligase family protein [Pyrinomonadaceae bacterium]
MTIPDVALTEFVLRGAGRWSSKPALIDGQTGRHITYGELADSVRRAAAGLSARGLRKGEVCAIYSPNCPEYAIAFHAVASLGGVNTTINPVYTVEEVAHQLRDAQAVYLLTVPQLVDKAREAARAATGVREIFVFGEAEGATAFAALLETEEEPPSVEIDPREDLVALPYSSGTTGLPKGVMLTHRNLVANLLQVEALRIVAHDDTLICVLPMFHIYGMVVIMNLGLSAGATIITVPRFEMEQFLKLSEEHGVTLAHLVPPIVLALAKNPIIEQYDLSRLKTIFSGAAPLGEDLTRACQERLGCRVIQGYGMTETSPAALITPFETTASKPGSVGICVPNTECKLVSTEDGTEQGLKGRGEIWIRGPQVMKGYLNRPEATAQTVDADGWLHTGDIAYADEDGHFYIVDRLKELIKYKGFQVAPAELEAVLLTHPCVADAAVIPSPDEEAGEVPKAFIVLRTEVGEEEIMEFIAERVAPYKKLRFVEFVEQIPKSPAGKILRRVLKERERERVQTRCQPS